jgi:beta-galactosidase
MSKITYIISLILLPLLQLSAQNHVRLVSSLDTGWKFQKGEQKDAGKKQFDDSKWADVKIPHDWAIEESFIVDGDGNTGKLPWKGEGWYRKNIYLDKAAYEGKRIYLLCDGIMAFPTIYLNGQIAGKWDYGYNSFYLDITDYVIINENNQLAIHADTRAHDSRWYPGAGIYRKMQLIAVNPVHIDIWGLKLTTPIIKPHYADVNIETSMINHTAESRQITIIHSVFKEKTLLTQDSAAHQLTGKKNEKFTSKLTIQNPRHWDIEDPFRYQIQTRIFEGKRLIDSYDSELGIREIRFDADHGFFLNNRRVQLKGVNLHHDHGPLGAAFNKRAMQRQLEIMQEMGCNAVRNSHNTAAPELLDLCDEMGILVLNEIFDKYDGKADIRDTTDFEKFTERNIRNFIKRDRNHPSIFLWSVGNEIGDVQWDINGGFDKLKTMINYVRKFDPTRPVTLVCDSEKSAALRHFDFYDVHNWNYGRRYKLARQIEPNKSVIISESASTLSTRGFYEFPLPEKKTDFTNSLQVSSYDLNAPWWAELADDDFMWQQDESYIAGEFVWTGFDYLGEPTPYNNKWTAENGFDDADASRSSYFGIVDLCGIPKDRYFLYKSYWKQEETTIHILPHWNWPERKGKKVPVFVYTNGDCAELFLNGISLGTRCKDPKSLNSTERFRLMWKEVIYEPGELKAIVYKNGKELGHKTMQTAGTTSGLRLTADRSNIKADGYDLSYVLVEAYDKSGIGNPLADDQLKIIIEGPGEIAGVCNGNPQSFDDLKSDQVKLFYGKAMVIIQSGQKPGIIKVRVEGKSMTSVLELQSKK